MTERLQLNLRLDKYRDLYESIKAEAKQQKVSVNQFVVDALKKTLGQETESFGSPEALKELEKRLEERLKERLEEQLEKKLEERLVDRLAVLVDEKIEQVLASKKFS